MNLDLGLSSEFLTYRETFKRELFRILDYWMNYAPDPKNGGFWGAVDLKNQPVQDAPRSCVLTARILWTFAEASILFPDRGYQSMADRAYAVLQNRFLDPENQGYYMSLDGRQLPFDTTKHTYVQAFVLYALSKYYELTQRSDVGSELSSFFLFIDSQTKDPSGPGYLEGFSRNWTPITDNRMADDNDPKSMNTHLHLLEAYAAVYKVWKNDLVRLRLAEILVLFQERIIRPDGHLGVFFNTHLEETKRSKEICSFGHDIEASWLILEALEIIDRPALKAEMQPLLVQMARVVFREGMDQDGGLFLESTRSGSHLRTNKHWWLQAELLVGEMNAWQLTGDLNYWEYLKRTWEFINQFLIDKTNGEWFTKLNRLGVPFLEEPENDPSPYYRNDWKIDPWKCPYHNGRALMELIKRIDKTRNL